MSARPDSNSHINRLNIASMMILLAILLFFFFKSTFVFETQKWIYLILGCMLITIDALRIVAIIRLGHRKLLILRIITLIMVIGFLIYWLYLHF